MAEPLDPDAADRVLRRASDLAGPDTQENFDDGIEPEVLIAAAADVGIPELAVKRSLAIEQLGPEPEPRPLDDLVGPATIAEQRLVRSPPEHLLDRLDRWLVSGHHLRRERRRPGEGLWQRRSDVVGSARWTARNLTGEGRLGDVRAVHAEVQPVDGGEAVLRVTIDRSGHRRTTLVAGGTLGVGGAAVGVTGLILTAPIAFAAIPAVLAGGVVVNKSRNQADRFERELSRLLDAIEADEPPPGMLNGIRRRLRPNRRRRSPPA
ncbi:MAG: hypothetical protein ACR2O6_16100 [Ilumatobacteraceae bacterium]